MGWLVWPNKCSESLIGFGVASQADLRWPRSRHRHPRPHEQGVSRKASPPSSADGSSKHLRRLVIPKHPAKKRDGQTCHVGKGRSLLPQRMERFRGSPASDVPILQQATVGILRKAGTRRI